MSREIEGFTGTIKIGMCPFCKKDKVKTTWQTFPIQCRVECHNWEDDCCCDEPQERRINEDDRPNDIMDRAIKKWNKGTTK